MLGGMEEDVVGFPGRGLGVVRGGLGNGEPVMADDIALDSVEAFLGHSTRSKSKDFADDMNNATDSPESSAKKAEEPETICRVCHMEGTEGNPLYSPCNCRGSIEYVHQDCLQRWLAHKNLTKCEVCNWTFQYKSIYAEGAPESPRTVDLLFWIVKKCALLIPLLFNIVLAVCLFFFLMPLLTCWMYRVCFLSSPLEIPAALYQYSSQSVVKIWTDSQIGVLICAAIIFVSMIIASLREFLRDNVEAGRPEEADGDIPFVLQPDDERNGNAEDQPVEDDDLFGHWFGLVEHPLSVAISIFLFNMVFLACAILVPLSLGRLVFAAADVLFPTLFAASTVQTLPDVLLEAQMDTNASKNGVSSIVEATYVQIYSYFYNASMLTSPTIDSMGSFNSTNISSSAGLANSALNNTVVDNGLGSAYGVRDSSILLAGYLALVVMVLLWSALTQLVAGGRVPVEATIDTTVTYAVTGIKVCTVTSLELIAFPIMMGWSVDILTLDLVGGTWEVRKIFFKLAPFTCLVVHWFIGFIFMISVSFFASLLRKIIRKNVLAKILRYPDDPDFQPFRELVTIPFFTHIRRVLVSAVVYNVLAVLCCHIPAKFYIWLFSSLVPLHVRFSDPTEVPVDLILFHFCAPFAFERFDLKDLSLQGLKSWFYHVSRLLGLVEYLLIPERGNRDDGDDQGHEAGDPVGGDDHLAVDDDGQQDRDAEIENDSESEAQLPENAEAVEASESVMGTKEKSISMEVEDDLDELVPRQRSQEPTDIHIKPRLCEEKESGDSGERTESEDEEESKMPAIVTEMGALRNEASQEILDGEGDGKLASLYLDDDDDNLASLYKTNDSEKHDGSPQVSSLAENNNSESDGHGVDTVDVDGQEMTPQELMEMLDRLEALDRANEEASDSVSSQGINHFQLRVFVLLLLLWFTDVVCIGVSMLVPLFTGRFLMQRAHKNPHDLYALLAGFYFYFLLCLVVVQTYRYLRQRNLKQIVQTSLTWLVIGFKCSFLGCFLAGVLPLLVGVIFDLSFVVPIRFPLDEEPQLFLYQVRTKNTRIRTILLQLVCFSKLFAILNLVLFDTHSINVLVPHRTGR